jgi:hypothetical protein
MLPEINDFGAKLMINIYINSFSKACKLFLIATVLLLNACTKTTFSTIHPNGSMKILEPIVEVWKKSSPIGWIVKGNLTPDQLSVVKQGGRKALKVKNGLKDLVIVKPVHAPLLATPYMSWAWNMEVQVDGQHPISLFVGFKHGNQKNRTWITNSILSDEVLPSHNRILKFTWGDSALQRGTIVNTNSINKELLNASFTVRGGQENSSSWWFEAIDLYDIYRRTWPNDIIDQTQIKFIGFGTAPSKNSIAGYISNLRISR